LIPLLLILGVKGQTCSWYVSPGGSDTNAGTVTAPWRTLQRAFDGVQPGQTACLRGGTYPMTVSSGYNQSLTRSGTAASPITFTNYPGEVAIVRGNTRVSGAYARFLGSPSTAPGLIFEGPTRQPLDIIDVMYAHDITIDHVEIRNGDYHAGLYQSGGYNVRVTGCYIHDNGRPGYINNDQGIYWDATTGGGNLIANNVVEHNVAAGIQLYPSPSQVTVEENTIVNNGNYGMELFGTQNTVVNNILANNGSVAKNAQMKIDAGATALIDANLFWSSNPSRRMCVNLAGQTIIHAIFADPKFVDPASHNYRLRPDSPAIGIGNASYTQPADHAGITRGLPPDLGAYGATP